jgi:hypothetical protein
VRFQELGTGRDGTQSEGVWERDIFRSVVKVVQYVFLSAQYVLLCWYSVQVISRGILGCHAGHSIGCMCNRW